MGRLSSREKQVIIGGGILAFVFVCIQFIYLPAYDKHEGLKQTLGSERHALERIRQLEAEYQRLGPDNSDAVSLVEGRAPGFTLFSFLDRQAAKSRVKDNIDYMKPHSRDLEDQPFTLSVVKLKLKQIVFKDFLRFIREVEAPGHGIWITSISLTKSGKTQNRLDAVLETQTLMAKGTGS